MRTRDAKRAKELVWTAICAGVLIAMLSPVSPGVAQSPLETPVTVPAVMLHISDVEPRSLSGATGGTLSIYGNGFQPSCSIRLVGHGLLPTSHVSPTALTAQVPPGIPAGTYAVEVTDGTDSVRLDGALAILAPTPTPAPRSTPPPGHPILTIRSYKVTPSKVRAGEEFEVTIEVYNNGSRAGENTMVVFPGTSFVPVGEPGHLLWQLPINHTVVVTQPMRAPTSLNSGLYQVQVNLGTNDWEGNHYDYPQTVPVEVIGATPIAGRPRVTIEGASTSPAEIVPGAPFALTLFLANRGSRTARNVFATCGSDDWILPAASGSSISTPRIDIEGVVSVTLPLHADLAMPGGRHPLSIDLSYEDYDGTNYSTQEFIGLDADASLNVQPQLLIREYWATPATISPGDTFTLTVEIANVGGGTATRLTMALGGETGAALEPFSPLTTGNVGFVDEVWGEAATRVTWRLMADGAAQPKAYNVPVTLAYDDAQGIRHSDTQRLSLMVRRRPELQGMFYREPESLSVGVPTAVSLEVLNIGSGPVDVTGLAATSDRMEITSEGSPFIGPVESGGSAPLDVTITPRRPGRADITICVTYRDDFNQSQTVTATLSVEVAEGPKGSSAVAEAAAPSSGETSGSSTLWKVAGRIVKGLLGFGG